MSYAVVRSYLPIDDETTTAAALEALRLGRIVIHRDPAGAREAWEGLETQAALSAYQTRAWVAAWLDTTGRATGIEPFIVVAYDEDEQPLALLPLGLRRQNFVTVGSFLGGWDSNFNLGLFRPGERWSAASVETLLRRAAVASRSAVDLFILHNQPHEWEGFANPLGLLPNQPSPSFGYKVGLTPDTDRFFRSILSKEGRKKLRRKAEKLAEHGTVEHRVAITADDARAAIRAFEAQRTARCAGLGLGTADLPDLVAFLTRASLAGSSEPVVEWHALYCGSQILATLAGTTRGNRFSGMVISFDSVSDLSRLSPGELLLGAVLRAKCDAGIAVFDLGVGEARYKDTYCPEPEPLFETLLTLTWRGRLFAAIEALRLKTKRSIKQSTWAWPVAKVLRRLLRKLFPTQG